MRQRTIEYETRRPRTAERLFAVASSGPVEDGTVLLETTRTDAENDLSLLFRNPVATIKAHRSDEVPAALDEVDRQVRAGFYAAGFVGFEAAYGFESLDEWHDLDEPLVWFGIYREPLRTTTAQTDVGGRPPVDAVSFSWSEAAYADAVKHIRHLIREGDVYQVNLTGMLRLESGLSVSEMYATLKTRQRVGYSAYLRAGNLEILSLSPELFFRREGSRIWTRPMKGTGLRGRDLEEDASLASNLMMDPKTRAENLMIVDLLRNDLSRISRPGSVSVPDLFRVETYETVLQMTSTIKATLEPDVSYRDIFRALFPCGSVTGAPKIRAMEIIRDIESGPRGVYTGAIGYISPDEKAVFNVAIRTIVSSKGELRMGTGGGIVWDSSPEREFEECLTKSRFLTVVSQPFSLIETIRFDGYYRLLNYHLERLARSSAYFGFELNIDRVRSALQENAECLLDGGTYRVRMLASRDGQIQIENRSLSAAADLWRVIISAHEVRTDDRFLYHKTTRRELYDTEFKRAGKEGFAEVLFTNDQGYVAEGSRTNIYVERNGMLVTPPKSDGLLPGVYRQFLLDTRTDILEDHITVSELLSAESVYLSNAIIGLMPAQVAAGISTD